MATQLKQEGKIEAPPPFEFKLIPPYSTRIDGKPIPVPYIIEGLLTQGGFSLLAAKPKQGKSSMLRAEAVCVSKGIPFLGWQATPGEVILVNLEDPLFHVDNCLEALGHDPKTDSRIHIINKLPPTVKGSIDKLEELLSHMPDVRLVMVDHLAKFIRVSDLNDYSVVQDAVERLRNVACNFPNIHIQATAHCKKIRTDDVFDSLLGSTALRGETDTNVALYEEAGQRVIVSETRIGKSTPPTIIKAELVDVGGANVVQAYTLHGLLEDHVEKKAETRDIKRTLTLEQRIVEYLRGRIDHTATQAETLDSIKGRRETVIDAISAMETTGVIIGSGTKQSRTDPWKLTLNPDQKQAKMRDFINRTINK